jgi:hypothetical protein
MLSSEDQRSILKEFPKNIELSYEPNLHKKVYIDFYLAIPNGKKGFMWFTEFKNQNVCFFLEVGENKQIHNLSIVKTCFSHKLSYGTVFYGTQFHYKNKLFYSTEDIFYYKGKDISKHFFFDKLKLLQQIYSNKMLNQVSYFDTHIIFGLPLICRTNDEIKFQIPTLPYTICHIQERTAQTKFVRNVRYEIHSPSTNSQWQREKVFNVKPDIQNDIYHLYLDDKLVDIAFIPDYATSVMMNGIFRNIKENINLDKLEESDNEDEFEDDRIDKHVYLDKNFKMVCKFNNKFKKWTPNRLLV